MEEPAGGKAVCIVKPVDAHELIDGARSFGARVAIVPGRLKSVDDTGGVIRRFS